MKIKFKATSLFEIKGMLLTIMKSFIFLFCTTVFSFSTGNLLSQNVKIRVNSDKIATVEEVLDMIDRQTEYSFVYSPDLFKGLPTIQLKKGTVKVSELLRRSLSAGNLEITINKNDIIIIKTSTASKSFPLQISISGKITDDTGQPLPGANILEKGTRNGTQSDFDGDFAINVDSNDAILVISYIGFATQEIPLNSQTNINVQLFPSASDLNQVIVIGYGTQKVKDITGSVASIGDELNQVPTTSFDQGIQGRAAGVLVGTSSGSPGAAPVIRIRGINSISGGTQPLYVIDGVPVYPENAAINGAGGGSVDNFSPSATNVLSTINPQDIESIQILKDASATAIYGARGANGVIIVTTKRGKNNRPKFSIDYSVGLTSNRNEYDLLNASEFARLRNDYDTQVLSGQPSFTDAQISDFEQNGGTDWQDALYRIGIRHNLGFSVNGRTDKTRYFLSTNYYGEEGISVGNKLDRVSLRANLDFDITDKFRVGNTFTASFTNNNAVPFGSDRSPTGGTGVASQALRFEPTTPIRNNDGDFILESAFASGFLGNPVAQALTQDLRYRTLRVLGNFFLEYDILDGLTGKVSLGYDAVSRTDRNYQPIETTILGRDNGGVARRANALDLNWLTDYTLTYDKIFGEHSLNAVVGFSAQANELTRTSVTRAGFISDINRADNLAGGTGDFQGNVPTSNVTQSSLLSYLGRVNYSYKDRYLLTLSGRVDGSSRFSEGEKYGFFPSIAVGWRLSEEPFLQNSETISNLKLRGSYGVSGNNANFVYRSLATLSTGIQEFDNATFVGVRPSNLVNDQLIWEQTAQFNVGLNASLWGGKLDLTLDYYNKETTDLLVNFPLAPESGIGSILLNSGSLVNKGFEITASSQWHWGDDWNLSLNGNIAFNSNEVTKLRGDGEDITSAGLFLNQPLGTFLGYVFEGVDQSDGSLIYQNTDTSNPAINGEDRVVLGQRDPKYIYGFNTDLSYKAFTLNLFFQGAGGHKIHNAFAQGNQEFTGLNAHRQVLNAWTPGNTNTSLPALGTGDFLTDFRNGISSLYLEDADYLRLKNISLTYNLPEDIFPGVQIFMSGTNLLTITGYKGQDPELIGVETGRNYPFTKTISLGLNVTF